MKKIVKWLVLWVFISSSFSFAIVQTAPGSDKPPIIPGGCKSAVAKNGPIC